MIKRLMLLIILGLISAAVWLLYPAGGVPILAYHRVNDQPDIYSVSAADFEQQMKYLADSGYTAISLAQLVDGLSGQQVLPKKAIVITFDDGYEDNYTQALPIMEKYGMKATVFVIPSQVGQPEYLSWSQILALKAHNTEIGSHTLSHAALTELTVPEQERELVLSKQLLEQHLHSPVEFLAYPYGQFDPSLFPLVRQSGYRGACSGIAGLNNTGVNVYALKRVNVPWPKLGLWEFRLRLLRASIYAKLGI